MSSAIRPDPNAAQKVIAAVGGKVARDLKQTNQRVARLGMSPRQQHLNHLYSFYKCEQYAPRKIGWDGSLYVTGLDHEAVASAGFIPPGYYDAQGAQLPLKFRRPSTPYHLLKVIVDRFTSLLFSERRHPALVVEGDPVSEDFVTALAEAGRLWPQMIMARSYGGSMGSVALGFQFVAGKPLIEVHDPRWVTPYFSDRAALTLSAIEKKYMYPVEVQDPETGIWHSIPFWYRRIIDETQDVLFAPAPVGDGEEPEWVIEREVKHGLGFCPVQWVQNMPVQDDIDGDPDCLGVYEQSEALDALLSQANKGIISNCDPTVHVSTDQPLSEIRKGSDNAIKTEKGGSVSYVEISGSGPLAAREFAGELRKYILEVTQCVLEHPDTTAKTATEIERMYSSMLAKADILREQYGERGFKPLVDMMLRAARKVTTARVDPETNGIVRSKLELPPRIESDDEGRVVSVIPRVLGPGGTLQAVWGGYFEPSIVDAQLATQAAAGAKAAGLIDNAHAIKFVAELFRVEDVPGMIKMLQGNAVAEEASMQAMMLGQSQAAEPGVPVAEEGSKVKFFQYEIEGGLVTINEVRATKGLGPLASGDGDLTLPEYRAKNAAVFAASTLTQSPDAAERVTGAADIANAAPTVRSESEE